MKLPGSLCCRLFWSSKHSIRRQSGLCFSDFICFAWCIKTILVGIALPKPYLFGPNDSIGSSTINIHGENITTVTKTCMNENRCRLSEPMMSLLHFLDSVSGRVYMRILTTLMILCALSALKRPWLSEFISFIFSVSV